MLGRGAAVPQPSLLRQRVTVRQHGGAVPRGEGALERRSNLISAAIGALVAAGFLALAGAVYLLLPLFSDTAADRAAHCTELAGSPYEAGLAKSGVPLGKVDASAAVPACRAALADDTASPQINYRLSRALYAAKSYDESVGKAQIAAQAGYAPAQNNLAAAYRDGAGIAKDRTLAAAWFQKAADQGFVIAQTQLGLMYLSGDGVTRDPDRAVELLRKASEQGDPQAEENLGRLYIARTGEPGVVAQGADLIRKSAEANYPDAQFDLGWMLENGRGEQKDAAAAADWYRKSADGGDPRGQFFLGRMLAEGRGVAHDDVEAAVLLRKAADQNHAPAQNYLGQMYQTGRGVPASDAQAVVWFAKAANAGLPDAQNNLGWMLSLGRGAPRDAARGLALFKSAASQGSVLAVYNVGVDYAKGWGVAANLKIAVGWYKKAADAGYEPARIALNDVMQAAARQSQAIDNTLDRLVTLDSRNWMFNRYNRGSMRDGQMVSASGSTTVIGGVYTFNNRQRGWVKARLVDGKFSCIEFWDFAGRCRALGDPDSARLAVGGLMLALGAASGGSSGSSGGGYSGSDGRQPDAIYQRVPDQPASAPQYDPAPPVAPIAPLYGEPNWGGATAQ